MLFDVSYFLEAIPKIFVKGVPVTLAVAVLSLSVGFLLGIPLAAVKVGHVADPRWAFWFRGLQKAVNFLVAFIRGIPNFLLLFLIFFGVPGILQGLGIRIPMTSPYAKILLVTLALTIAVAAHASEMFRSAYLAVDPRQLETAESFGYTGWQVFLHVLLPQAFYVSLPNLNNRTINLFQATSLIGYLGVLDIMGMADVVGTYTYGAKAFEVYVAAGVIYCVFTFLIDAAFTWLEKRASRGMGAVTGGAGYDG